MERSWGEDVGHYSSTKQTAKQKEKGNQREAIKKNKKRNYHPTPTKKQNKKKHRNHRWKKKILWMGKGDFGKSQYWNKRTIETKWQIVGERSWERRLTKIIQQWREIDVSSCTCVFLKSLHIELDDPSVRWYVVWVWERNFCS